MRITKVYTKTGDKGSCALATGDRVSKAHLRIECYGTVDELNSFVGLCRAYARELKPEAQERLDVWLESIQNDLFVLGSDLATPPHEYRERMRLIGSAEVEAIEKLIDYCQTSLNPLREFILPSGSKICSYLHVARTVCRRAERLVVSLQSEAEANEWAVPFLNRLSDFFFVLSRWVQAQQGLPEVHWDKTRGLRFLEKI